MATTGLLAVALSCLGADTGTIPPSFSGVVSGVLSEPAALCTASHTAPSFSLQGVFSDETDAIWSGTVTVSGVFLTPQPGNCAAGVLNQVLDLETGTYVPEPATFAGSSSSGTIEGTLYGTFLRPSTQGSATGGPYWQLQLNHISYRINEGPQYSGYVNMQWIASPTGVLTGRFSFY